MRAVLADNLGISPGNDYGLLERVGGDVAGAITLLSNAAELATDPTSVALSASDLDRLLRESDRGSRSPATSACGRRS